ncbi:hypothetical protein [Cribrihabitans pelagius]|uniref:hypothetical protein n=1 Tax=Cribrihabitans pelagius TaxID=1765746 RepID=UPI003B599068
MANCCPITRVRAAKDLHPPLTAAVADKTPTPIFRAFTMLTDAVESAVEMERDLSHAMSWDPASSGFAEAAENQWHDCLRLASDVFSAPPASSYHLPVQRMAMLLHFLIEATSPDEAQHLQHLMYEHRDLFSTEDPGARQALNRAARHVDAIVEMAATAPDFTPA